MKLNWTAQKPTVPGWYLASFPSVVFPGGLLEALHLVLDEHGELVKFGTIVTPDVLSASRWCGPIALPDDAAPASPVKYPPHKPSGELIE